MEISYECGDVARGIHHDELAADPEVHADKVHDVGLTAESVAMAHRAPAAGDGIIPSEAGRTRPVSTPTNSLTTPRSEA